MRSMLDLVPIVCNFNQISPVPILNIRHCIDMCIPSLLRLRLVSLLGDRP